MPKSILLIISFVLAFSLVLSSAAFYMSFDVYTKAKNTERQQMCEKQQIMDFFECMKG
ncbi:MULTISPECIES: hypothetical protein [Vibrio]|uniref:hypothetical protein n=1 Tax=Vibrio TaxID=662 RepID=UPI002075830B|nr:MULTISPECIES: hypothetical protein [Vibrio]USD35607.1 hypothetical protein J8Z27_22630 [Vibrio sp. SCSIO 43186]USD72731.1 hypothetical protein J4N41_22635 [Vibrio sp. SCSIO 43139]